MNPINEAEKAEYAKKLVMQIQTIDRILKLDSGTVVSTEVKKLLRTLKTEAETVLRKLNNNEFEIAIVGMEKAGKSTFANALMSNNLLPTKDPRCTFTSTQIQYSGDNVPDSAEVTFYSSDEFDRDFKDKLAKLGFPNPDKYSFDTISLDTYQRIYDSDVPSANKGLYGDTIHEDIKSIIKHRESLSVLLGRPTISFSSEDMNQLGSFITSEEKARAVKRVIIRSSNLNDMRNAIIFDVPGFNSPTELHKIQTFDRMKSADAIIVVANGEHPSITEETLKILRASDDEGNPLNDKLFVYANRIDCATNIQENIDFTVNEWVTKGFVSSNNRNRIIPGCARAYLQANGLDSDNRVLRSFNERKDQLTFGDGIEHMREVLAEYNANERFEVLKRRINRINSDIIKAFSDIQQLQSDSESIRSFSTEQLKRVTSWMHDTIPACEGSLLDLKAEIREYMPGETPLSNQIIDYVTNNITIEKCQITQEAIDKEKKRSPFAGTHEDVGRMEGKLRKDKFDEMYDDFSRNVINIADKHHADYSRKIIDSMLCSMGISSDSPYYEELRTKLTEEISAYRGDLSNSGNSNALYYQSLIERFSRDIYEILILSQYSPERLRAFYESIDIFYSLSVFYKKSDSADDLAYINTAPKDQPLCMMLLFHHYLNFADTLRGMTDDICRIAGIKSVPDDVWKFAENAFSANGGKVEEIIELVKSKFTNIIDKTDDFKVRIIKETLGGITDCYKPCSVADKEGFTQYYERYFTSVRSGKLTSIDDIRTDFNADIQILQDVLKNAFVRAISMETPFVAKETKSIDDIISYIKSKQFGEFLSENYWKIKFRETQELDKHRREQEQNAAIINEINIILTEIKE